MAYVKNGTGFALHHAIRAYGIENFEWSIIDGANSKSELTYKETHYMYIHNSFSPNGYNLRVGNWMPLSSRKKQSNSLKRSQDSEHLKHITELSKEYSCKKVKAINEKTGDIKNYPSIVEASKDLRGIATVIGGIISGRLNYRPYKGYWLERADGTTVKKLPDQKREGKYKKIKYTNLKTGEERVYNTQKELIDSEGFSQALTSYYLTRRKKVINYKNDIHLEYV